jgi:nitronate monooxygenase
MPLPATFEGRLTVPVIAAPMFLVSGPDLVAEACRSGVVGTFPALNQRSASTLSCTAPTHAFRRISLSP